jgi:predicted MPP superfamily phosphohydrolase
MAKKDSRPIRKVEAQPKADNVILHLSDLHFGREKDPHERTLVLGQLARELHSLEAEWQPTHLCITGDVADNGHSGEYKEAASWLHSFLKEFAINPEFVFICPGNHDVDWNIAKRCKRPRSNEEVDAILRIPLPADIERGFKNYCKFLKSMKIPLYSYKKTPNKKSYLFGIRDTPNNLHIFCCNSCFYSWDETSKGKLLLGNKLFDYVQAENLVGNDSEDDIITIALVHHSKEKLDESEYYSSSQRPPAFNRLAEMTQLILMGHEHAQVNPWDRSGYGAYHTCIGSAFYGIEHPNSFQLFSVNRFKRMYECKYFQWNPSRRRWLERTDIETCWPFDRGTSSQDGLSIKATQLAAELWNLIKTQDFTTASQRYKTERDWFLQNKDKIDISLAELIDLYFQEISLWSD